MSLPSLILASASPSRARLLRSVGLDPLVIPSHYDETLIDDPEPARLVSRLALAKAETVAASLPSPSDPQLVLGCDSVLELSGEIYGKPANPQEAIGRWQAMGGQVGYLHTGHALLELGPTGSRQQVKPQVTAVRFACLSDREIEAYVATGEPLQCAGGFALEGRAGWFIESLTGCYSNVLGLSLPLVRQMLIAWGYEF